VGMMMRDENVPEVAKSKAGKRHLPRDAVAAIDDIDLAAGNDRLRAPRSPFSRSWAACGPQQDQSRRGIGGRSRAQWTEWKKGRSQRRYRRSPVTVHGASFLPIPCP